MTHPNITCAEFEALLPDYLEEALSDSDVASAELHLASCAECRALVADLREITRQAATLPALVPSRDLWPEIEARTQPKVLPLVAAAPTAAPAPHRHWSRMRLGAIAAALVGVTAIGTWQVAMRQRNANEGQPAVTASAPPASIPSPESVPGVPVTTSAGTAVTRVATVSPARPEAKVTLAEEIAKLRGVLTDRADDLDPTTIAILEASIATIDTAIAEAQAALTADPASQFLNQQLNKSLERKLGLLRKASLLSPST